jgi:hypothetical protein
LTVIHRSQPGGTSKLIAEGIVRLEFEVRRRLAATKTMLAGLYVGTPKRATAHPTAERLLEAFHGLTLAIIREGRRRRRHLTLLFRLRQRILALLDFSRTSTCASGPILAYHPENEGTIRNLSRPKEGGSEIAIASQYRKEALTMRAALSIIFVALLVGVGFCPGMGVMAMIQLSLKRLSHGAETLVLGTVNGGVYRWLITDVSCRELETLPQYSKLLKI